MEKISPVIFTEKAISEIKHIFQQKKVPEEYLLRVTSSGNGCSGVDFKIGFDKVNSDDETYQLDGFKVAISKKDFMFLIGVKVDFIDESHRRGFIFVEN